MDDAKVLDFLNRHSEGAEAAIKRTYVTWIHNREVTVEVYDRGVGTGELRYYAHAHWTGKNVEEAKPNSDGNTIGNPDSTIDGALFNLHWQVFREED
jgi:hypothetical protein